MQHDPTTPADTEVPVYDRGSGRSPWRDRLVAGALCLLIGVAGGFALGRTTASGPATLAEAFVLAQEGKLPRGDLQGPGGQGPSGQGPAGGPSVQGEITGVSGDVLTVSTQAGELKVRLTDTTAIRRAVTGKAGDLASFQAVYHPTWGRFKAITRPAVGNHEYGTRGAAGYFSYFGAAAGDPAQGYYRWELAGWTLFVLNSGAINWTRTTGGNPSLPDDCWPVSCAAGSEQEQWLRSELEALPDDACVIAYWHHPRFSSGFSGANQPHAETGPLFADLYQHGVELLLTGHSHNYERLVPVTPDGIPDPGGVTQFVVGTGGRNLHINTGPQLPITQVLRTDMFGVLELTLEPGAYTARFVGEDGLTADQSSGTCHPPPPGA